jgi:flagellar motor switch protein FliM
MSTMEILSQEEIETLLLKESIIYPDPEQISQNIDTYDITLPSKKSMEAISALEVRHETFARIAELKITELIAKKTRLEAKCIQTTSITNYLRTSVEPVFIQRINIKPNNHFILFILSYKLISNLIESLFGGIPSNQTTSVAELGTIDIRISELFCDVLSEAMSQSWQTINHEITIQNGKAILNPSLLHNIIEGNINISYFDCIFNNIKNDFSIIYPDNIIQDLLNKSCSSTETELSWYDGLYNSLQATMIHLTAKIPDVTISLKDLLSIKIGDIIPIDNPTESLICAGHLDLFSGKCTKNASKRAIVIEDQLLENR